MKKDPLNMELAPTTEIPCMLCPAYC